MTRAAVPPSPLRRWSLAALASLLLAACGDGGRDGTRDGTLEGECSVPAQQSFLGSYMSEWYFWYRLAPRPDPAGYDSVQAYFDALLYTGTDPAFPADRWSRSESSASFNRFYGDGATLGFGVAVNGIEAVDRPGTPLYVRYVEPRSDAAAKGVQRGDEVVSINGRSAAELVSADDFGALTAADEGDTLRLMLRRGGVERSVTLVASTFAVTPVAGTAVYTTQGGRKLGYVMVKDMIAQAQAGLDAAFADFRAQGVQDLVLDLRYNGGGLVSIGATVASYVAGARAAGQTFARLLYNDQRASSNQTFTLANPGNALGLARVFVLTGPRTCSASEQVINGLRGVGLQVIAVGDTTCGKPVGSLPRDDGCGTTYSVINFESVNARDEGRYFDGFDATCPVAEDCSVAQGDAYDPLLMTAAYHADTGLCAPLAAAREQPQRLRVPRRPGWLTDERSEMVPR
jgi:carboxyl-terminal processing protease